MNDQRIPACVKAAGPEAAAVLLRLAATLRDASAELEALARGADAPRPPWPTRGWCLLPDGRVRWAGEPVPLRRGLRDLLGALLDLGASPGRPVALCDVEDVIGEQRGRLGKSLSELNAVLSRAGWPRGYHSVGGAHIITD